MSTLEVNHIATPFANGVAKSNSIEMIRYACSIGAMHSASAIPRVIPITHCGPGCANKQFGSLALLNGFQGGGYGGGAAVPSTNATERDVVFGGADRLKELITATLDILDADLFVVVTGCISDLVGDDVQSVVGQFQKRGVPIVCAETGGFKGNNFTGHELVTKAIIDQYVGEYEGPRDSASVNVWSLLPYQNPFWRGDLAEIKRILEGIGLKANILFGPESGGVEEWKSIPQASFNLVLSPWLGLSTAEHLKQKYNQPYLHFPVIPIGAQATGEFLRAVSAFAGLDAQKTEKFVQLEEQRYYPYLADFSDFFAEYSWGLPAKFSVVADSAYGLAISNFLSNQLGLIPGPQFVTEDPHASRRDKILQSFETIEETLSGKVTFEEDTYFIHQQIRKTNYGNNPPLILGSSWERDLARELKGTAIEVVFPASHEVILSRSYVGYRGALTLLEHIYSATVNAGV
jgi:nitrogenase molybdenum-iron protein beta chain